MSKLRILKSKEVVGALKKLGFVNCRAAEILAGFVEALPQYQKARHFWEGQRWLEEGLSVRGFGLNVKDTPAYAGESSH